MVWHLLQEYLFNFTLPWKVLGVQCFTLFSFDRCQCRRKLKVFFQGNYSTFTYVPLQSVFFSGKFLRSYLPVFLFVPDFQNLIGLSSHSRHLQVCSLFFFVFCLLILQLYCNSWIVLQIMWEQKTMIEYRFFVQGAKLDNMNSLRIKSVIIVVFFFFFVLFIRCQISF